MEKTKTEETFRAGERAHIVSEQNPKKLQRNREAVMGGGPVDNDGCETNKKKRKRKQRSNLVLVQGGQSVEVRSVEEGFEGSWHPGKIIKSHGHGHRLVNVRYDHILVDDYSRHFTELVHRNSIRPTPPPFPTHLWGLHYGLCVDALVNDAWWEGVVFDHNDGSNQRLVFFPDRGDQEMTDFENLRITQDWDRSSNSWNQRGHWLFLQLLEKHLHQCPSFVSVRQLWYDLTLKPAFATAIKHWWNSSTCPSLTSFWNSLLDDVIRDNLFFTAHYALTLIQSSTPTPTPTRKRNVHLAFPQPHVPQNTVLRFVKTKHNPSAPCNSSWALANSPLLPNHSTHLPSAPNNTNHHNLISNQHPNHIQHSTISSSTQTIHPCAQWLPLPPPQYSSHESFNSFLLQQHHTFNFRHNNNMSKFQMHLLIIGWKIEYKIDKLKSGITINRYRYTSPQGNSFYSMVQAAKHLRTTSLLQPPQNPASHMDHQTATSLQPAALQFYNLGKACKLCIDEQGDPESITKPIQGAIVSNKTDLSLARHNISSAIVSTHFFQDILPINKQSEKCYRGPPCFEQLEFGQVHVKRVRGPRKRRRDGLDRFPSKLLPSHATGTQLQALVNGIRSQGLKKSSSLQKHGNQIDAVLRSSKRVRQVLESSPAHHTPRNTLSWLIDNNIVLPRAKVCYMNTKNQPTAKGRITRDGIRCNCCNNLFGLSRFEVHAGSTKRRPAANIFLEDGRSLLQCQQQMMQDNKLKSFKPQEYHRTKSNRLQNKSDSICSVCHYGGKLVLCDQCPSSFHLSCIGLDSKDLPKGKWFCPSCRCGICGQSEFNGTADQFTEKTILYCDQCEREYHVGCLRKTRSMKLDSCPEGNWFCSKKCEKIFMGLHKLLGKQNPVGVDNLSWTILRSLKEGYHRDAFDVETLTEYHSKLNIALKVLHECFEPIKDLETKDLVRDVIFNKRSVLKRLNFKGFYTVLLEKEDELISVATVRVYGEKVAEVPLVGTRVRLRRLGMCRILMNALEKKLTELGVERLLLPAIPQVLHTWTSSFGFSEMTKYERLNFVEYTFLDFPDTTMCQKILKMAPKPKGRRASNHRPGNELSQSNEVIDLGSDSGVTDTLMAKDDKQIEIMEELPVVIPVDVGFNIGTAVDDAFCDQRTRSPVMETLGTEWNMNQPEKEMGTKSNSCMKSIDEKDSKRLSNKYYFKYYRRRKTCRQSLDSVSYPVETKQIECK